MGSGVRLPHISLSGALHCLCPQSLLFYGLMTAGTHLVYKPGSRPLTPPLRLTPLWGVKLYESHIHSCTNTHVREYYFGDASRRVRIFFLLEILVVRPHHAYFRRGNCGIDCTCFWCTPVCPSCCVCYFHWGHLGNNGVRCGHSCWTKLCV